jgi:PAS domain-containing protein
MLSSDMSAKPTRPTISKKSRPAKPVRQAAAKPGPGVVPDGFYKDMVWNLRNGVVAITRDGRVAVMNDIAYRVLGLKPRARDIGRHFTEVLKDMPDVSRIVAGAFELSHLPNRAELRSRRRARSSATRSRTSRTRAGATSARRSSSRT